jgi:hypothetical protein
VNQSSQQATPGAPSAAPDNGTGITVMPSLEERSAAAFEMDTPSESAVASDGTPAPPGNADPAAASGGVDPAAERAQARHRESADLRKRLDEAEKRAEAAKGHVDPSKLDEAAFFDMATKLNVTPQRLGEWLRERMQNPELAAEQAAARVLTPQMSALEAKLAEQQKVIDGFLSQQQAQQQQAEERYYMEQIHTHTRESAATSPYAARFLEAHGPVEYAKVVMAAARGVPPGVGAQGILDEVEERLASLASIYAPQTGAPQQRAAPTPPFPAAAKAPTTVSNTLAQTRASFVDEDAEWSSLPFEERSARLFR